MILHLTLGLSKKLTDPSICLICAELSCFMSIFGVGQIHKSHNLTSWFGIWFSLLQTDYHPNCVYIYICTHMYVCYIYLFKQMWQFLSPTLIRSNNSLLFVCFFYGFYSLRILIGLQLDFPFCFKIH